MIRKITIKKVLKTFDIIRIELNEQQIDLSDLSGSELVNLIFEKINEHEKINYDIGVNAWINQTTSNPR